MANGAFQAALVIDSSFVDARFGLALALFKRGGFGSAKMDATTAQAAGATQAVDLLHDIDVRLAAQNEKAAVAAQK